MRRINAEIQGGKVQEYWRISSLSDAEVQYLDKQKIQDLVGGSIYFPECCLTENYLPDT